MGKVKEFISNLKGEAASKKPKPPKPPKPEKPKVHLWIFHEGLDEPIRKTVIMDVTLSKSIKPGWRRKCSVATDEDVDLQPNGTYARSEMVEGDSTTPTILPPPESAPKLIQFWVNGDGAIGTKKAKVVVDAHVGEGDVALDLNISYEVASPDATEFQNFQEGVDEQIPV